MDNNYKAGRDIPPVIGEEKRETQTEQNNQASSYYIPEKNSYEDAKSNATIAMVLGILSLCCVLIPWLGWVVGIVLGIIGLIKAKKARNILRSNDRGQAIAGFVCSIIGIALCGMMLLWFSWFFIEDVLDDSFYFRYYL